MRHSGLIAGLLAAAAVVLALSGCVSRNQVPVARGEDNDDAFCQAAGHPQGSSAYVACRKDRDVQRAAAASRADRRQRDLAEDMLNHPVR
ncbi:MAG: hypothetical protein FWD68_11585 [Alphaproteobacteria bacterium]|nr:hypothetical protein [Alphaproteobacteria bacterium]